MKKNYKARRLPRSRERRRLSSCFLRTYACVVKFGEGGGDANLSGPGLEFELLVLDVKVSGSS